MAKDLRHYRQTHLHHVKMGEFYGYPECCIIEFCDMGKPSDDQLAVGDGKGFLPCTKHTKQILEGKTSIDKIIKNRQCKLPYPGK